MSFSRSSEEEEESEEEVVSIPDKKRIERKPGIGMFYQSYLDEMGDENKSIFSSQAEQPDAEIEARPKEKILDITRQRSKLQS